MKKAKIQLLCYERAAIFAAVIILVSHSQFTFGQQKNEPRVNPSAEEWDIFAPPRQPFRIELPGAPKQTAKHNPGKADETEYFRCARKLDAAYKLELTKPFSDSLFEIGIFDVSKCKRNTSDLERESLRLVKLFSADDDCDKILRDEKRVVDGYSGRFFLVRTCASNFVAQMFVEANGRVYWISYATDYGVDNPPTEAERIFSSFHVQK